jgi:hypothetical protein
MFGALSVGEVLRDLDVLDHLGLVEVEDEYPVIYKLKECDKTARWRHGQDVVGAASGNAKKGDGPGVIIASIRNFDEYVTVVYDSAYGYARNACLYGLSVGRWCFRTVKISSSAVTPWAKDWKDDYFSVGSINCPAREYADAASYEGSSFGSFFYGFVFPFFNLIYGFFYACADVVRYVLRWLEFTLPVLAGWEGLPTALVVWFAHILVCLVVLYLFHRLCQSLLSVWGGCLSNPVPSPREVELLDKSLNKLGGTWVTGGLTSVQWYTKMSVQERRAVARIIYCEMDIVELEALLVRSERFSLRHIVGTSAITGVTLLVGAALPRWVSILCGLYTSRRLPAAFYLAAKEGLPSLPSGSAACSCYSLSTLRSFVPQGPGAEYSPPVPLVPVVVVEEVEPALPPAADPPAPALSDCSSGGFQPATVGSVADHVTPLVLETLPTVTVVVEPGLCCGQFHSRGDQPVEVGPQEADPAALTPFQLAQLCAACVPTADDMAVWEDFDEKAREMGLDLTHVADRVSFMSVCREEELAPRSSKFVGWLDSLCKRALKLRQAIMYSPEGPSIDPFAARREKLLSRLEAIEAQAAEVKKLLSEQLALREVEWRESFGRKASKEVSSEQEYAYNDLRAEYRRSILELWDDHNSELGEIRKAAKARKATKEREALLVFRQAMFFKKEIFDRWNVEKMANESILSAYDDLVLQVSLLDTTPASATWDAQSPTGAERDFGMTPEDARKLRDEILLFQQYGGKVYPGMDEPLEGESSDDHLVRVRAEALAQKAEWEQQQAEIRLQEEHARTSNFTSESWADWVEQDEEEAAFGQADLDYPDSDVEKEVLATMDGKGTFVTKVGVYGWLAQGPGLDEEQERRYAIRRFIAEHKRDLNKFRNAIRASCAKNKTKTVRLFGKVFDTSDPKDVFMAFLHAAKTYGSQMQFPVLLYVGKKAVVAEATAWGTGDQVVVQSLSGKVRQVVPRSGVVAAAAALPNDTVAYPLPSLDPGSVVSQGAGSSASKAPANAAAQAVAKVDPKRSRKKPSKEKDVEPAPSKFSSQGPAATIPVPVRFPALISVGAEDRTGLAAKRWNAALVAARMHTDKVIVTLALPCRKHVRDTEFAFVGKDPVSIWGLLPNGAEFTASAHCHFGEGAWVDFALLDFFLDVDKEAIDLMLVMPASAGAKSAVLGAQVINFTHDPEDGVIQSLGQITMVDPIGEATVGHSAGVTYRDGGGKGTCGSYLYVQAGKTLIFYGVQIACATGVNVALHMPHGSPPLASFLK